MTYSSQLASQDASVLATAQARASTIRQARPLAPGVGLTIGALASLALWGGFAQVVIRLVG